MFNFSVCNIHGFNNDPVDCTYFISVMSMSISVSKLPDLLLSSEVCVFFFLSPLFQRGHLNFSPFGAGAAL